MLLMAYSHYTLTVVAECDIKPQMFCSRLAVLTLLSLFCSHLAVVTIFATALLKYLHLFDFHKLCKNWMWFLYLRQSLFRLKHFLFSWRWTFKNKMYSKSMNDGFSDGLITTSLKWKVLNIGLCNWFQPKTLQPDGNTKAVHHLNGTQTKPERSNEHINWKITASTQTQKSAWF